MFLGYSSTLISSIALPPFAPLSLLTVNCTPALFSPCLPHNTYIPFFLLFISAIAPDFSQNLLKAQTLARQGGDVLIECKPKMSPRGVISWRKGKEALRENHRYQVSLCRAVSALFVGSQLFSLSALLSESYFIDLFYFPYFIFMVTNSKEQNHSVTQYNLNCITRSAPLSPCYLHFFPQLHCTFLSWLYSELVSALFT